MYHLEKQLLIMKGIVQFLPATKLRDYKSTTLVGGVKKSYYAVHSVPFLLTTSDSSKREKIEKLYVHFFNLNEKSVIEVERTWINVCFQPRKFTFAHFHLLTINLDQISI